MTSLFKKKKRPDEVVGLLKNDLEELAATTDEKASEKVSYLICPFEISCPFSFCCVPKGNTNVNNLSY